MRQGGMHWGQMAIGVVVLGGAVAGGYHWTHRQKVFWDDLNKEVQAQKTEVPACRARLAQLYKAVLGYRKDHKGALPGSFEELIPKYVADPKLYICPTAARWLQQKGGINTGHIHLNGEEKEYRVTYGFRWLGAGYHLSTKRLGDKAPLIVCESHQEALYASAYHRALRAGYFTSLKQEDLVEPVRRARALAVRTNGKTEELALDEQ